MRQHLACQLLAEQHTHDLAAEARLRERDEEALVWSFRKQGTPTTQEEAVRRYELIAEYEDRAMNARSRVARVVRSLERHVKARWR